MVSSNIIVHIGAGNHSKNKNRLYKSLLRRCLQSGDFLEVSRILEGSLLTNTGYGSSLDFNKEVKCDASYLNIEEGNVKGGSMYNIDALYPISSVISSISKLDKLYQDDNNVFGLSKPILLDYNSMTIVNSISKVGDDHKVDKSDLISTIASRFYEKYKEYLFDADKRAELSTIQGDITDTIGLIDINNGITKVAASSGGNFFKLPGRIGCAGIIGASIDFISRDGIEICCTCSGNGEHIIETKLASFIVNNISIEDEENRITAIIDQLKVYSNKLFMHSSNGVTKSERKLYIGAIVTLRNIQSGRVQLIFFHSTESFYFGFKAKDSSPEIVLSRLNTNSKPGIDFANGEYIIK